MLSFVALSILALNTVVSAASNCSAPNPSRLGVDVIDCNATWTNGEVKGLTLLTSGNFAILSKAGVSVVPIANIVGSVGVAPAALTYITGFSLDASLGGTYYANSYMVHGDSEDGEDGRVYGADSTSSPSPLAVLHAGDVYDTGMGRDNPTVSNQANGVLDGLSLYKGAYKFDTDVFLNTDAILSLNGQKGDVFIFQSTGAFNFGTNSQVLLFGTLTSDSVYFLAATSFDLGQHAIFNGLASTYTTITIREHATVNGRLHAQTTIAILGSATVYGPSLSA